MNCKHRPLVSTAFVFAIAITSVLRAEDVRREVPFRLVLPRDDKPASRLIQATFSNYLDRFYELNLRAATKRKTPDVLIVFGSPESNPLLKKLVKAGLKLSSREIGDEGFQIVSHEKGLSRYIVVYAKSPRALKHACQELIFYHLRASVKNLSLDWPLNLIRVPELPYRGIYMLPCWSAHDSIESWERVLRFNSELTLNRNWFWLDGFPVAGHTGEYTNTPLANERAVQRLIDLVNGEAMRFYIGGGWFMWHHKKAVGHEIKKGTDYYLSYLKTFKGVGGFYFEPTGEPWNDGRGDESKLWLSEVEGLQNLIGILLKYHPELEVAVAIGRWNNSEYLKRMAMLDRRRVYWWWCWGDPIRDQAMDRFPNVLRWHNQFKQSPPLNETHGSREAPMPSERKLAGLATSFDPAGGFGSPWHHLSNPKFLAPDLIFGGTTKPENFDPHTVPYFYLQYLFRERCWNLELSPEEFEARLQWRLFDADAPEDAGKMYANLSRMVLRRYDNKKLKPTVEDLEALRSFLDSTRQRTWTPRMIDTLHHMEEAFIRLEKR